MGVTGSQPRSCIPCVGINESEEVRQSRGIDRGLRETRRNLANTPKILLLGAGESGKSTIIKQMRILNNVQFSEYERELYRVQVFYNLVGGMRALLEAMRELAPDSVEEEAAPVVEQRRPPFHVDSEVKADETPVRFSRSHSQEQKASTSKPEVEEVPAADADAEGEGGEARTSRSPTRSPSLSLNIFNPGALSQRQHAALLNELHYIPDIRPGEPFPIQYEGLLRGLFWGWDDGGGTNGVAGAGAERPAGSYMDRIQSETGIALPDNLSYFFKSPHKLAHWFGDEYVPSDEDVLRCRGRTTGIQETVFTLGKSGLGGALREQRAGGGGGGGEGVKEGLERFEETGTGTGTGASRAGTSSTPGGGTITTLSGTTIAAHTYRPPAPPSQHRTPLHFPSGKTRLHLVDVGGQRSERRKWMHCFQGVTAVLFLVGLSGYSQGMLEDPTSNQMQDAMALWDGVCSSQWFRDTSLILFLNKSDLFAEKLERFPIRHYFPDYEGGDTDVAAGKEYFRRRFLRLYSKTVTRRAKGQTKASPTTSAASGAVLTPSTKDKGKGKAGGTEINRRTVYSHFTTATDTAQLKMVMVAVCDIILRDNLLSATFF